MTSELDKYIEVSKMLDSRVSSEVREVLVSVPTENPYTVLKSEIIKRLCASQEEKTHMLLESQEAFSISASSSRISWHHSF